MIKSVSQTQPADRFDAQQLELVTQAVATAEDLVSNHYKMSTSQWLKQRFDVKTQADLTQAETVAGPFAQVIRYEGKQNNRTLGSAAFDFYKICLQDKAILDALRQSEGIRLFPFVLYIIVHELIHIVRFSRFQQNFTASPDEMHREELRVHRLGKEILSRQSIDGLSDVLAFYARWHTPVDDVTTPS